MADWTPVVEGRKVAYYEVAVPLGLLRLWATAQKNAWLIEESGGGKVAGGVADSFDDAKAKAIVALQEVGQRLRDDVAALVPKPKRARTRAGNP
jgi:hypothetical protein